MITRNMRLHENMISRRALILGGMQALLAGGLAARLYYLQIQEGLTYNRLSERNKYDFRIIPPSRGRIFDMRGRLLAGNAEAYALSIIPDYTTNLERSLRQLAHLIELSDEEIVDILKESKGQSSFLPIIIRSDLTQREVSRLVVRSPELSGVSFAKVEKRIYPQGLLVGHLTGYVNRVTKDEISAGLITPELASLSTGKTGVEKAQEQLLRGAPGRERILVNALGRPIRTAVDDQPTTGLDVRVSIDVDCQYQALAWLKQGPHKPIRRSNPKVVRALAANERLAKLVSAEETTLFEDSKGRIIPPETGSVVVMDIHTGAVRTLVSSPTFDPNLFSGRISTGEWSALIENQRQPLLDRALSGQYSPGSTFKMLVALAALEAGVISEKTSFFCPGHKTVGNKDFHCWQKNGHGRVNVIQAIEQSCDVFFYEIGLKTGIARIAEMARRLGLGEKTRIGLPGEKMGLIPDKDWKEKAIGSSWTLGETVNASIGQGYVLTTPLQLAVMTARLASGKAVVPTVMENPDAVPEFSDLKINTYALKVIQRGMRQVMNGQLGTARNHDLTGKGYEIAGKTGTVQVKAITKAERESGIIDNIDRPWKFRDHALFVGFAPYDAPKYAISVIVEHGGGGSGVAAPIASKVLGHVLKEGI
jgi:penicillin-binding protein 2